MTGPHDDPAQDPDEHVRYHHYQRLFDEVTPAEAAALVTRVLADPDRAMANSAVCEYLDRRAAALLTDPQFPTWQQEMAGPVAVDEFSARRLTEWALLRTVALDEPWSAEELLTASNWLQLRLAETGDSPTALATLTEGGRTRRIRTIADSRSRRGRR
ncbi:hypothetical protein [Kitasatospora sp. NPDC004289]